MANLSTTHHRVMKVTDVSESIPLCPALRIEVVYIIVGYVLRQSLDLVFEALASESRGFWMIQRPADYLPSARPWTMADVPYLIGTISPLLISLEAVALTRVGVRRFKRPICPYY